MFRKVLHHISNQRFLYSILILAFWFRVVYIFVFTNFNTYLASDMGAYEERALQMLNGQYVLFSTYWAPFFHIFLAGIYSVIKSVGLIDQHIAIYVLLMALLSVVTLWCVYQIALKLFGKWAARIALMTTTIWYPLIYLNIFILSENVYIPLLYSGLYFLLCRPRNACNAVVAGLLLGLATIARPVLLVFLPLYALWHLWQKVSWQYLVQLAGAVLIIVGMQSSFNYFYTNGKVNFISAGGGFNFALEWCDLKSIEYNYNGIKYGFAPPANNYYDDGRRAFSEIPFENQGYYYGIGLTCLRQNPTVVVTNLRSVKNLFSSQLFPYYDSVGGWEILHGMFAWLDVGLLLLAVLGMLFKGSQQKYAILLGALLFSLFASVYLQNPGEERYLYPYLPAMIILASYAIVRIRRKLSR